MYAGRLRKVDDGATEQAGEMQDRLVETVDAGVMWIGAGVVVDVDAGERAAARRDIRHLAHQCRFGCRGRRRSRPYAVVIVLAGQGAHPCSRCIDVADEQQQGTGRRRAR